MTASDGSCTVLVPTAIPDRRLQTARAGWLAGYKPSTRASYVEASDQWFDWCQQHGIDPLRVERAHIDLWGRHLEEQRKLMPATVAQRLCTLRSFYRYCEEEDLIPKSPAARCRLPKVSTESSTHGMTRSEATRFLAASKRNSTQHALVCLLLLNGLRISEACSANVEALSVEYGHRTLTVARKGGKVQTLPLAPAVARALDAAIGERTDGPLLLTVANTRMTRTNAAKVIARLGRRANIPYKVHPHLLRHAHATIAFEAGVPLHEIQDGLGHADPRTTMRYNRHRHSLDRNPTHLVTAFLAAG